MTTGNMPGISHEDEDPQGDEVKVFKTSEEHSEIEQHTSGQTLFEDKADIAFCADVEGTNPEPSTSGANSAAPPPPAVVKPQATSARSTANNSATAGISPSHPVPSKNGPSLGRTHLINGTIGSKPQTAFVPANKLHQPSINTSTSGAGTTVPSANNASTSQQGQNILGSPSTNNSSSSASSANNSSNGATNSVNINSHNFNPSSAASLSESLSAAGNLAAAAAAAANFTVPTANGFIPTSSPAFLFWPAAPGYSVLGQPFALPAASPLFFPGLPRPVAPAGGPPPAHNGGGALGALALDPTKIGGSCSPSYTSPYFPPAGYSPNFDLPFTPSGLAPSLARFSPMPLLPAASPANLSPIHSPQTGTPIVPGAPKQTVTQEFLGSAPALRLASDFMHMANMAAARNVGTSVSLPPSVNFRVIPASPLGHPLASMASLKLPNVTTTVTSLATTLATQPANGAAMTNQNQALRRSASDRLLPGKVANGRRSVDDMEPRKQHIKKPLNAFMLYMKENRSRLMEEKGYKERQSAELNKELGRMWHTLSQEDQQKYYQMAREEKQKHHNMYPEWSARDNYAVHKKKKRKRDKISGDENLEQKKCRARFGLDQQVKWCKHCRRKKKCLWFREGGGPPGSSSGGQNDPESSEQSPVQVSSTTQGSPLDQEAAGTETGSGRGAGEGDGPPPPKMARGSSSSDVSSPSAVSSTTKQPTTGNKAMTGSDDDDDVTDDEDDDTGDEEFDGDVVDYDEDDYDEEEEFDEKPSIVPVKNKKNGGDKVKLGGVIKREVTSLTPPTDQSQQAASA